MHVVYICNQAVYFFEFFINRDGGRVGFKDERVTTADGGSKRFTGEARAGSPVIFSLFPARPVWPKSFKIVVFSHRGRDLPETFQPDGQDNIVAGAE